MLNRNQYWKHYGIAIASVAIALFLMVLLDPILQLTKASFLFFFAAVAISAFYGGRNPGIVATLLSAVFAKYYFLDPNYSWTLNLASGLRLAIFILEGTLISLLIGALRTAQAQVTKSANQLKATEAEIEDLNQTLERRVNELQTLFNAIPINIAIAEDADCRVVRINPAYAKLLQIPADVNAAVSELPQYPFKFYQNGQELAGEDLPVEYTARHGVELHDVEIDLVFQDNTVIHLYGSAVPLLDESGKPRGSIGVYTNITELRKAELALRDKEQQLQLLSDLMPQFVWMCDARGKLVYVNQQWIEYSGLTLEQSQDSQKIAEFFHPDDQQAAFDHWSIALQTKQDYDIEIRLQRATDSVYRWFLVRCVPQLDEQGQVLRWIGTSTDIHDRKLAQLNEQFLKDLDLKLRQSSDVEEIQWEVVSRLGQYLEVERAVWDQVDTVAGIVTVKQDWRKPEVSSILGIHQLSNYILPELIDLFQGGHSAVIADVFSNPYTAPFAANFQALDASAFLAVPCISEGRWVATLTISSQTIRYWRSDEVALIQEIVSRLWSIIEQKRAVQALRESEEHLKAANERFQLAAKAVNCLIYDWRLEDDHVERTDGLTKLFGYSLEEAEPTSQWWRDLIHPDDLRSLQEQAQKGLAAENFFSAEYRILNQLNQYVYVLDQCLVAARDEAGQATRIVGSTIDISDRKQAESELQQRELEFRTLVENTPDIITRYDRQLKHLYISPNIEQAIGIPAKHIIGKTATELELMTYPTYQSWYAIVQQVFETGEQCVLETEIPSPNGEIRFYQALFVPELKAGEQVETVVSFARDITEYKRALTSLSQSEEQLRLAVEAREQLLKREREAREVAERANRVKDEFLSILSHELRTPLNPILGWSKLLQTKKLDEAKTVQALATIERNAKLQTQLIDDLLDVAKILRGKLSLQESPVNLVSVIEASLEVVRTAAEAKFITLIPELTDIGQVKGDGVRLQQIVWNLLSNAIKFTPAGGRVNIRLEQVNEFAQLTVTDTGKGISSDFLPYIFESFRQGDASITRNHGGLGLGLSIVKYLVDAHGGTITAESLGEGQGATFTVKLPLLTMELIFPESRPLSRTDINLAGIKVLAVDDNEDARNLLVTLLTQYGAEVKVVDSAIEVLEVLQSVEPHILICDIGMPEVDGYALLNKIRALPSEQCANIPAIALTAYAREEDQKCALEHGFQKHMTKPLEPEILAIAVLELMLK